MTGKEDWEKKYREEIEEVNLRADMLCAWNDELENKLSKYERAFEILKNVSIVVVDKNYITITINAIWRNDGSGAYELLEELMKSENS